MDDAYLGFINLVAGQISSGLANAQAYEEAQRRAEVLAELDRAKIAFFPTSVMNFGLRLP